MNTAHNNSFDIIRHIAAFMVLFSHHYALSGMKEPTFFSLGSYGSLGVTIFFVISGYLITKSCIRSDNFVSYMEKRIRRIFPALFVCCFLMVFIVIPFFTPSDLWAYFTSSSTYSMFSNGVLLLGVKPKDIFTDFIYPVTINGSLWTLPYEFLFYILVGAFIVSIKNYKAALIVFFISLILAIYIHVNHTPSGFQLYSIRLDRVFKLLMLFSFGSLLAFTENSWNSHKTKIFLSVVCILLVLCQYKRGDFFIFGNIALCFLIIAYAVSFKDHVIKHRFDISYGVYIYAFPVQQIVINKMQLPFYYSVVITVAITSVLAALSWVYVERRFLKRG
ncbi:hypothetical protein CBP51_12150 [Cellvibrio mixtus]|uniref:Acyltransferase 3 domain-containing protein n=1 Tax=Cellvibrio mixtus TaxID=39650 RepID=A0A266QCS9_9GAMM|nr:acyltransferase [Cellvibrio mixtus]OZY87677.1 hypothetical protein CBP51_12150 [Cellvibrio mixtus]